MDHCLAVLVAIVGTERQSYLFPAILGLLNEATVALGISLFHSHYARNIKGQMIVRPRCSVL